MANATSPLGKDAEVVWDDVPQIVEPLYGIDESPKRAWETLLYGWQHTLVDISPFVLPLAVAAALGMAAAEQAQLINACLVAMGLATLLQTTWGNGLPIIQGPSATLTGTLAPMAAQLGGPAMWGAAFVGGLIESVVGASGLLRFLRKLFPAVVSGVVITTIGLSLGRLAIRLSVGDGSARNLWLATSVIALVVVLQTVGRQWLGGLISRGAIFIAIWTVGLGVASMLGLMDWSLVASKPWLALPSLMPFGGPWNGWHLSVAALLVVLAGYFGSMVESLGDYAATCAVAGETYTVRHMNRGIAAEGLGSALAALIGALPCTSYTQNVGIIATTRVASRRVVQVAACILIAYGLCPKFGALLVAMPRPVLGGVFIIVCGMIVVSGIRLLQAAPSTPNHGLTIGITLIVALGLPAYVQSQLGPEWVAGLPSLLGLLVSNSVVLAVVLGVGLNGLLGGNKE